MAEQGKGTRPRWVLPLNERAPGGRDAGAGGRNAGTGTTSSSIRNIPPPAAKTMEAGCLSWWTRPSPYRAKRG